MWSRALTVRPRRAAFLAPCGVVALAIGCASASRHETPPGVPSGASVVEVQRFAAPVASFFYAGRGGRRRSTITDAAAWAGFWTELTAGFRPRPPVPDVDFASEMVIVAGTGGRPNGGYSIHLDGVYEAKGRLYVLVRETSPGPNCWTTQSITSPHAVVRLARRDVPVVFVERAETRDCA